MKRRSMWGWGAAAVVAAALASGLDAQTITQSFNKVVVRSTATDAIRVLGGATVAGGVSIGGAGVSSGLRVESGAVSAEGAAVATPVGFTVLGLSSSPDWAQIVFGDGTGYRLNFGTRSSGNFTSRLQVYDTGSTRFASGSESVPSVSFISDSDTGLYNASSSVFVTIDGTTTTRTYRGTTSIFSLEGGAFGAGAVQGAAVTIARNSSGNGAPGCVVMVDKAGTSYGLWPDSSGNIRTQGGLGIGACPTESGGDTVGTVVGTQTSARSTKDIHYRVSPVAGPTAAMAVIRDTPVFAFSYKDGAYNGETFYGITTDDSPLFGMDRGKSFNPVNAFGATVLALQDLDARVRALERDNAALRAALARAGIAY